MRKGQAILELAIFGTLMLFVFSMLLVYGQRLDAKQNLKMEAFRKALQMAYYKNSAVSYTKKHDSHITDLFSGYGQGQYAATQATASVMWQKGQPGEQGVDDEQAFGYYQINDKISELPRRDKTVTTHTGEDQDIKTPAGVWKEEIKKTSGYSSNIQKEEGNFLLADNQGIRNRRQSDLQETLDTDAFIRFDRAQYDARDGPSEQPLPNYDYGFTPISTVQGAYLTNNRIAYNESNVGTIINKQRTWRTVDPPISPP